MVQATQGYSFNIASARSGRRRLGRVGSRLPADCLFLDEVESFDALLHQCQDIQEKANAA
jgi:hypothetical protein